MMLSKTKWVYYTWNKLKMRIRNVAFPTKNLCNCSNKRMFPKTIKRSFLRRSIFNKNMLRAQSNFWLIKLKTGNKTWLLGKINRPSRILKSFKKSRTFKQGSIKTEYQLAIWSHICRDRPIQGLLWSSHRGFKRCSMSCIISERKKVTIFIIII